MREIQNTHHVESQKATDEDIGALLLSYSLDGTKSLNGTGESLRALAPFRTISELPMISAIESPAGAVAGVAGAESAQNDAAEKAKPSDKSPEKQLTAGERAKLRFDKAKETWNSITDECFKSAPSSVRDAAREIGKTFLTPGPLDTADLLKSLRKISVDKKDAGEFWKVSAIASKKLQDAVGIGAMIHVDANGKCSMVMVSESLKSSNQASIWLKTDREQEEFYKELGHVLPSANPLRAHERSLVFDPANPDSPKSTLTRINPSYAFRRMQWTVLQTMRDKK